MKSFRQIHAKNHQPSPPNSRPSLFRTSSASASSASASSTSTAQPSQPPAAKARPASAFAFTQINVASFDRAEAFFERVFGWRFIGEPAAAAAAPETARHHHVPSALSPPGTSTNAASYPSLSPGDGDDGDDDDYGSSGVPQRVAPPIAPPPDHRVNYFGPGGGRRGGGGGIAGALFKFRGESRARNFSGGGGDESRAAIPSVIHYVAVEDMAATLAAIRLAGGKTVAEPWKERDGMAWFALFEDPDGNVFGLIQYLV